jgi:hypothetical protein
MGPPEPVQPVTEAGPPPAADATPAGPPAPGAVHPAVEAPPAEEPKAPAPAPAPAPAAVTVTVGQPAAPAHTAQGGQGSIRTTTNEIAKTVGNEQEIAARQADLQNETAAGRENIGEQRNQANQADIGRAVETEAARKATFEKRRGEMEAELTTLKDKIAHPPTDVMGIVTTLAAAIANTQGRGDIAQAFTSVGGMLNKRMQRYKGEIEAGKTNIEGLGKLINVDHLGALDETEQQSLINKAVNAEMLSAVDTLAKSSTNREEANKYLMAGQEIRKKALETELRIKQAAAAKNKALALKAADARMHRAIFASDDPAVQLKVAKQFGPEGDRVLKTGLAPRAEMLKQEEDVVGIEGKRGDIVNKAGLTEAQIAKLNRGAKGGGVGPGEEVVSGFTVDPTRPEVWNGLEKSVKAKYTAGAAAVPALIDNLKELKALVKVNGTEMGGEAGTRMGAIYGNIIGQVKEAEELGALDKGVETLVSKMIPDPTGITPEFLAHSQDGIDQAIKTIQNGADSKARAFGLSIPKMAGPVTLKDSATGQVLKPMDAAMAAAAQKANPGRLVPVE